MRPLFHKPGGFGTLQRVCSGVPMAVPSALQARIAAALAEMNGVPLDGGTPAAWTQDTARRAHHRDAAQTKFDIARLEEALAADIGAVRRAAVVLHWIQA
eukprot:s497_g8.t1